MGRVKKLFLVNLIILAVVLSSSSLSMADQAKNVIFMIGDGMGLSHVHATSLYAAGHLRRDLAMTEIMDKGRTAFITNDTLDNVVTGSAEAATQMATGVKVHAKSISVGSDGRPMKTILEMAKERGKATGMVTTAEITDATPASFAAHVDSRSKEEIIADQLIKSEVKILLGGGKDFFLPDAEKGRRRDGRNLIREAQQNGYTVVETRKAMIQAQGEKILGLFSRGNMLFEIDRGGSQEPSLAEMTSKALEVLGEDPDGFFLVVEAGRIDHAAHHNDIGGVLWDTLAFDDAIRVAYEYQKSCPQTLLIITADHETGGLVLLPYSHTRSEFVGMNFEAISKIKASYEVRNEALGKNPTPEKVKEVIKKVYDIDLSDEEVLSILGNRIGQLHPRHFTDRDGAIAFALRLHHRIGWSHGIHSATPLPLWGIGPGSEKINGWKHNTELFRIVEEAYGF